MTLFRLIASDVGRPLTDLTHRLNYPELQPDAEKVLETLSRWMPAQYALAEVVGKWIWISFPEPPIERIRAELSQLGFHWNNTRQTWQHPCGTIPEERATYDPRKRYGSYFAADQKPA